MGGRQDYEYVRIVKYCIVYSCEYKRKGQINKVKEYKFTSVYPGVAGRQTAVGYLGV